MNFRFFVIDDAAFIRELIKGACLASGGVCVGESEGGAHSLDLIRQTLPDIVFVDLVLAGQNGIELAAQIRKAWPEARIIACTSLDQTEVHKKAMQNGIDSILKKPFTRDSLVAALSNQLERKNEVAT